MTVLAGCAADFAYEAPGFAFRDTYADLRGGAPVLLSNAAWWRQFDDATLDALVEAGLAGSLDLALAQERVEEARARFRAVPLAATLAPAAEIRRAGGSDRADETVAEARLGFSWLLDIHGARRAELQAADARVEAVDAEENAARLLLLLNITNAYVDLRHWQTVARLRREELASRRLTLELTQTLFEQNAATRVDLLQAEALMAETEAALPPVLATIDGLKNELAVLTGVQPGALRIDLDRGFRQPRAGMSPDVGIPADLLRNRPDIAVAERRYFAALADLGATRADLYPQLSLSGTISLAALAGGGPSYGFGPSLRFPLIPPSERRATVQARESAARQAHTIWQQTVLEAIRDVETALGDYAANRRALVASERAVRLYGEVVELTRDLVARNGGTVRDLVAAEQRVSTANTARAETLRRLGRSFVALNVSLGSGHGYGEDTVASQP